MRFLNLFYLSVVGIGVALFIILRPTTKSELSFYGFAESNETEINYNYPVVVDQILVRPGQAVTQGDILMHISRRTPKEILSDQQFKISELSAEARIWKQEKENDIAQLRRSQQAELRSLDEKIDRATQEWAYHQSLTRDLKTIENTEGDFNLYKVKLEALQLERSEVELHYREQLKDIEKELSLGNDPYRAQISRLQAEMVFDSVHKVQEIIVRAPSDGLIGNISCKEEEHVPSYNTLLSFYEPHTVLIRGFVHEDLTLKVDTGDRLTVASLKDELIQYEGRVVGLGSRIVEIPPRLRKIPTLKTFGREVLIEITRDNQFLQKEKVSISFSSLPQ